METDIRREIKKRLCREAITATTTIQAWIEQLLELCQDHEPHNPH